MKALWLLTLTLLALSIALHLVPDRSFEWWAVLTTYGLVAVAWVIAAVVEVRSR